MAGTYLRHADIAPQLPPESKVTPVRWVRANLFSSPGNTIITILAIVFLALIIPPIVQWAFIDAAWSGSNRSVCLDGGACWAFIGAKFNQFMYFRYPVEEQWRVNLVGILFVGGLVPLAIPRAPFKRLNALFMLVVFPIAAFILLLGGMFGLREVETARWGGLMVTLVVAVFGFVISLPLGVILALGRRSRLPAIRFLSAAFIEIWRGVPLVTVLFMASVMLPFFLPRGVTIDGLLAASIGIAVFYSAYMAEVVRGGLQAIPRGQVEGAMALGLSFWRRMRLVILPQALALVIPGIVNTFIALFKDTSLVLLVSVYDLLGIAQSATQDSNWAGPSTPMTAYVFAGLVFWVLCFGMSRYSLFIERRLASGRRR